MPGVRVRVSSRGVRTSVGPRAARVHVGGGRTTLSSGVGPVSVWSSGGGRRTSTSRPRSLYGPSPAQRQRQANAIARAQAAEDKLARIRELIDLQRDLISNLEQFADAGRPIVDVPIWVHPQQYLPEAEQRCLAGVGKFDRAGRDAARRAAALEADQAAASYNAHLRARHDAHQAQADQWWAALVGNDEPTVIDTTNVAFADNASTAAALSVDGSTLAVLMIQPTADELGDQKAALTPDGKPTITRMTKTEQRQLWTACTLSRAVATISEAFAVAPGIQSINIAVVSRRLASSARYSLVLAGEAPRHLFRTTQWPTQVRAADLACGENFIFDLDRFGALSEIPTDKDPQLRGLVDGINGVIEQDDNDPSPARASGEPSRASVAPAPGPRASISPAASRSEHLRLTETAVAPATHQDPT